MFCDWKLFKVFTEDESENKETEKLKWKEKYESNSKIVNVSMTIEASIESGFQFWFQSIYLLPTLILSFMDIDGLNSWTDLFNWRIFSIAMSFATFAWTFFKIR